MKPHSILHVLQTLWSPKRSAAWAAFILFLLIVAAYFCGTGTRRALQHAVFIVPCIGFWLLSIPQSDAVTAQRTLWQSICRAASWIGFAAVFADAGVRAFLLRTYEAEPMSTFVLESAANTNLTEAAGFLATEWAGALFWTFYF